jgi:glycosyltransferase involved in cell wall biosynthesis
MTDITNERWQGGTRVRNTTTPLVSIIVVVFQDHDELERVLQSIFPHLTEEVEVVIIDGGSNDGTLELLASLDSKIDYWLSERDQGIYDAMNKGIYVSKGKYVLHINAGDRLLMLPLAELRSCSADDIDVVCGRVLIDSTVEFISETGFKSRIDNTWHHQGTFYRRASHLGYDASYRAFGDFDHNQKLLLKRPSIKNLDSIVADHRNNGITSGFTGRKERYRSIASNFGWYYTIPAAIRFTLLDLRNWIFSSRPGSQHASN